MIRFVFAPVVRRRDAQSGEGFVPFAPEWHLENRLQDAEIELLLVQQAVMRMQYRLRNADNRGTKVVGYP